MAKYMLIMRETEESRAASDNIDFDEMVETIGEQGQNEPVQTAQP